MTVKGKVDPITVEIIRNAFNSLAHEMNASLFRSAYSPVIYEMKDCSVGIFNKKAELLGQSSGLPIFLGNLGICIEIVIDKFGIDSFEAGDVFIMNDSYQQGTHVSDITVLAPVFYGEKLVGFAATRAAMVDVGCKDPAGCADSTDIYQEGIRIPPLRLVRAGVLQDEILELIYMNCRYHNQVKGDLCAQIASCVTGVKRMCELYDRYGEEVIEAATEEIFRQSEEMDREAVRQIPDGVYRAEGFLDNDGLGSGPLKMCVAVTVDGDEMTIDLTGSSGMARGPVNCGIAQAICGARVGFKEMINPQSDVSGGTFRNLKVVVPEDSYFNAKEPAPCGWYFTSLGLLIDLIVKALSGAVPQNAAAAHYGDSMIIIFSGLLPGTNELFSTCEATVGGWGGFDGGDGQNCLINAINGDFKNLPVEFVENKEPLRLRRYEVRPDSEGAGKYRGGLGCIREYEVLADECYLTLWCERSVTTAWGLNGGLAAKGPDVIVDPGTPQERHYLKANKIPLKRGSIVRMCTGGGGGFGDPKERDRDLVRHDVACGYLSKERAKEVYGLEL